MTHEANNGKRIFEWCISVLVDERQQQNCDLKNKEENLGYFDANKHPKAVV